MRPLTDRVVLITGASRGLGVEMARRFAREGSRLALAARSGSDLEKVRAEMGERGAKAIAVPADVSDLESLRAMLKEVESGLGPVDVLVNNAGIEDVFDFESTSPDRIEQIVQVNLIGPLWLTRLVLPSMIERRTGHICNISSLAGVTPVPHNAVYSSTKHGLVGMSRSLRMELEEHGVEVSVVCPGFVEGGMFEKWGRPALKSAGSVTMEQVADAVLKAVTENKGEIVVTKGLGKIADVTFAAMPEFAAKMMKRVGGAKFLQEQARINAEKSAKR
ncbi:MAG: SDR family oxidoreductase [Actinomycetota bacterium]